MKFEPLSNRIVGKRKKRGEKITNSGIVIPEEVDKSQNPYTVIEVLAVGRGYVANDGSIVQMESKVGDEVLLVNANPFVLPRDKYPTDFPEDEELVVFQESDIFVRINK